MRAAVLPGGNRLEIQERPIPEAGPNDLLVRIRAAGLNRADLHQRAGHYPAPPGAPQDIPGLEFAGEVAQLGANVARWKVGDRVFGIVAGGAHAEYLVTDADAVARVPDRFSWVEAGSIPEAFITAHDALVVQAAVNRNENVLIHAVGSGVGLAAVQLARAWNAVPFGTARTPDKIDRARVLGLENGVSVADDLEVIVAAAERWMGANGVGVTLDLVGGPYVPIDIRVAAPRGRIMIIGTVAGRMSTVPIGVILGKRLTIRGTMLRGRSIQEKAEATAAFARDVFPFFQSGYVVPVVDSVFELSEIEQAYERLASNSTFGKVVVRID